MKNIEKKYFEDETGFEYIQVKDNKMLKHAPYSVKYDETGKPYYNSKSCSSITASSS